MAAEKIQSHITPDEYLVLERGADLRSEYISGEMIAMSGASERHEILVANLTGQIYAALRGKPCGPRGSNLRVRVRSANYLYPDLTVVCGESQFADGEYLDTLLNPTAVFEILSNSTESRDRGIKWRLYQQIESLQLYVLIDQESPHVEIFTRRSTSDWLVHTEAGVEGAFNLPEIGVTISMADLYERITLTPDATSA
jgi:Uma2 family endonuclease